MEFFFFSSIGFGLVPMAAKHFGIRGGHQWPPHPHLERLQWFLHHFPRHTVPGKLKDPVNFFPFVLVFLRETISGGRCTTLKCDDFALPDLLIGICTQLQGAGVRSRLCQQQRGHLELPIPQQSGRPCRWGLKLLLGLALSKFPIMGTTCSTHCMLWSNLVCGLQATRTGFSTWSCALTPPLWRQFLEMSPCVSGRALSWTPLRRRRREWWSPPAV